MEVWDHRPSKSVYLVYHTRKTETICCKVQMSQTPSLNIFQSHLKIHTRIHTYIHTLHCIALHCIALHCIALHYITLHYIHTCITLYYITLHYILFHSIAFHFISLHYMYSMYIYIYHIYQYTIYIYIFDFSRSLVPFDSFHQHPSPKRNVNVVSQRALPRSYSSHWGGGAPEVHAWDPYGDPHHWYVPNAQYVLGFNPHVFIWNNWGCVVNTSSFVSTNVFFFHSHGVPKMLGLEGKILLKWSIWWYFHFRKPP